MYYYTLGFQNNKKFVKGRQEKHLPLHRLIENSEGIDKGRGFKIPTSAPSYLCHRTIVKKYRLKNFYFIVSTFKILYRRIVKAGDEK